MRDFEKAWDAEADAAGRRRAGVFLAKAVAGFFAGDAGGTAGAIDAARRALASADDAPAGVRWADALDAAPESRFLDADAAELAVEIRPAYPVKIEPPAGVVVRLAVGDGKPVEAPATTLPVVVKVPLDGLPKSADFVLTVRYAVGDEVLTRRRAGVSRVENLAKRLAALRDAAKLDGDALDKATLNHLVGLLTDLAAKKVLETDYPAANLTAEAEAIAAGLADKKPVVGRRRPGSAWLAVPTGKAVTVVRLFVPEKAEGPVPVVVALHGLGGSENLFFDGYGGGIAAKLCKEKGWALIAPRGGFAGAPVPAVLDELAKRFPLDLKRVYLVGHSMGAAQAVGLAAQAPEKYAGVAALGGGAFGLKAEVLKGVPTFVGVGAKDFALGMAQSLSAALKKGGADRHEFKEYDDIEHLAIVRVALPDVFAFFAGK